MRPLPQSQWRGLQTSSRSVLYPAPLNAAKHTPQLIPFLRDKSPAVRQIALDNLLGCTAKESPNRHIFFDGLRTGGLQGSADNDVVRSLKLLCRDSLVRFLACGGALSLTAAFLGRSARCLQGPGEPLGQQCIDYISV